MSPTSPSGGLDELTVDVLVVGAGLQGTYVARSLAERYSVCLLSDPAVAAETLDSLGWFSAGYEGDDAARIQPARRAAGYWRLWAETVGVPADYSTAYCLVDPAEASTRPRLWSDATLAFHPADGLPGPFVGGRAASAAPFVLDDDVIMNPGQVLGALRDGLEPCCVEGRIVRIGLAGSDAIDHVQVEAGEREFLVAPRFVLLAAGVGNADLLGATAKRIPIPAERHDHLELARTSQAVQRLPVVCVRGEDLPPLAARVRGLTIVGQPLSSGSVAWLVTAEPEEGRTILGADDVRFPASPGPGAVASIVTRLAEVSPAIAAVADRLEWAAYAGRLVQHPSLAGPDAANVARPVSAKLESFGFDGLLALWPSHLAYTMVVGDVVVERVRDALGSRRSDQDVPAELQAPAVRPCARWDRPDLGWSDWSTFGAAHEIKFS